MTFRPLILDRYLFKEFVLAFLAVLSFCALLLLVASVFDKFGEILEHGAPMSSVALYFLTALPGQLMHVIPIASMLAVLFSIGSLARTNEILAMLTSGVHGLRLSVPIIFGGIIIVIGTFVMNEYVVPKTERASQIYELKLENKDIRRVTLNANAFARGRNDWYYMAAVYSNPDKQMIRPIIINLANDQSTLKTRIEAETATFIENNRGEKTSLWELDEPRTWRFDDEGRMTTYTSQQGKQTIALEEDLPTIMAQQMKPEEMNYHQLKERVRILDARSQPTQDLRTDLLRKITFPIGILVIMLIGFSFAVKSRAGTAMAIVGYGISWAVAFYVISAVLQALGHSGTLAPVVATVVPTVIFVSIALHMMRRSYQWHA